MLFYTHGGTRVIFHVCRFTQFTIEFPLPSPPSDHLTLFQNTQVTPVNPFWLNSNNSHTSTLFSHLWNCQTAGFNKDNIKSHYSLQDFKQSVHYHLILFSILTSIILFYSMNPSSLYPLNPSFLCFLSSLSLSPLHVHPFPCLCSTLALIVSSHLFLSLCFLKNINASCHALACFCKKNV